MSTVNVIQQALNGIVTLMLAKFMMNDVPHAAGIYDDPLPYATADPWWEKAWADAVGFKNKKINQIAPPLDEAMEQFSNEDLPSMLRSTPSTTRKRVKDIKKIIGGYFWIATEKAPDVVVQDVFNLLNAGTMSSLSETIKEYGLTENRAGKIIAIDSYMSKVHEGGAQIDEDFYTHGCELSFSILELLDMLGTGPEIHRIMEEVT